MKFFKGQTPWNKGIKKRTNTGKTHFKKGNKMTFSEEHRRKIGEALTGKKPTAETLKRLSESHLGQVAWNKGLKKDNNHLTLTEKYTVEWRETLRKSIRERDKYRCKICGEQQGDKAHAVHHIDYEKKNNNPNNLITLCFVCHAKTNYNRETWIEHFRQNNAI